MDIDSSFVLRHFKSLYFCWLLVICSAIFFLYFQIVFYTIFVNLHHGTCVSVTYFYTFLFLESVCTWNFIPGWSSSWVEIILVCDEKSLTVYTFLPRWNFITEWTHPGMKKRKQDVEHFIPRWNFKMSMLFSFLTYVFKCVFQIQHVWT